ncbi:TPA: hypothetical protein ACX6SJ_003990, partial [Photobacterium damselae]
NYPNYYKWLSVKEKRRLGRSQKGHLSHLQIIVRIYSKDTQIILSLINHEVSEEIGYLSIIILK